MDLVVYLWRGFNLLQLSCSISVMYLNKLMNKKKKWIKKKW